MNSKTLVAISIRCKDMNVQKRERLILT